MRDDTVITAVIFDRGRAGVVGLSANAGDEEREDHLELGVEEECTCGVGGAPADGSRDYQVARASSAGRQ